MHNKKKVGAALEESLSQAHRVPRGARVFRARDLPRTVPRGLTLLDLRDIGVDQLNLSNIAARQEVRDLRACALGLSWGRAPWQERRVVSRGDRNAEPAV
jgi:chromosome partitioning protein